MDKSYLVPPDIKRMIKECLTPHVIPIRTILRFKRSELTPLASPSQYRQVSDVLMETYDDYLKHRSYFEALVELHEAMVKIKNLMEAETEHEK